MKAKVGDKVRITHTDYSGFVGYEVGDIQHVVRVDNDGDAALGDYEWFFLSDEFELITTISTQIKARMDEHMSNGEYVRAVKWAQVLEMVEGLEDE